jgi:hypothetical protein
VKKRLTKVGKYHLHRQTNQIDTYLSFLIHTDVNLHEYNTRRKDDLHVKKFNIVTCKNDVINMGIKLYNKLSLELRKLKAEKEFKQNLKIFLLEHPFYTLQEFLSESQLYV